MRRRLEKIITPFAEFAAGEAKGGIVLLLTAVVAFWWANSRWGEAYEHLKHLPVALHVGEWFLELHLEHWVNDGLMAIFFVVVGLEIKREILVGELSDVRRAALAVFAAIGGMVVPALLYTAVNFGGAGRHGWGIPMATDIAFALGALALLGERVPVGLKVLLTALAIVDDLGAVLVIAIFYTGDLDFRMLGFAAAAFVVALVLGRLGVRNLVAYGVVGIFLWYFMLRSGVHATIAGVLLALTVPIRLPQAAGAPKDDEPSGEGGREAGEIAMEEAEESAAHARSPLHRLEDLLHPWSAWLVMPVFALFNAGLALGESVALTAPVTLGVALGLFLGKPIGVLLASWIAVRLGIAALPIGVGWRLMVGLGLLAGIGFTMSLFVTNLAFPAGVLVDEAKVGVLATSLLAGVLGVVYLGVVTRRGRDV